MMATSDIVLTLAKRFRAAVLAARLGTPFEEELASVESRGFFSPTERGMWEAIAESTLATLDKMNQHYQLPGADPGPR
jgi:hypothetical protein